MQNAADDAAVIDPILAAYIRRQMRLNLPPLLVAQPKQGPPHLLHSESFQNRESASDSALNHFIEFRP
jgi:hypothetical protein